MKYIPLDMNENGNICVSYRVIAQIVFNSLMETPGIAEKEVSVLSKLINKDTGKTKVYLNEVVEVDVKVKIFYGNNILVVAKNVQEKAYYNIKNLLGLKNFHVNVFVDNLVFDKE